MVEEDQIYLTKEFKQANKTIKSGDRGSRADQYGPIEYDTYFENNQRKFYNENKNFEQSEHIRMLNQRFNDEEYSRNYEFETWEERHQKIDDGAYNNYGKSENCFQENKYENQQFQNKDDRWSEDQQEEFPYEYYNDEKKLRNEGGENQRYTTDNRNQHEFDCRNSNHQEMDYNEAMYYQNEEILPEYYYAEYTENEK